MASLATLEDFEVRAPSALNVDENSDRIDALLKGASARVRSFTKQTLTAVTGDVVMKRIREIAAPSAVSFVRLPQRPITAVHSVVDATTGAAVTYEWLGDDEITFAYDLAPLSSTQRFYNPQSSAVRVTYDHGYAAGDAHLDLAVEVVCNVALRAYGVNPTQSGTQQESMPGYSVTLGSAAAAGSIGLLPDEKEALRQAYRRSGTAALRLS